MAEGREGPVPPTTNFLNADERADLVKKSRKLAQVFGTTPGAMVVSQAQDELRSGFMVRPSLLSIGPRGGRHVRGAVSVSGVFKRPTHDEGPKSSWPIPEGTQYMNASGRRHSEPLSPDDFSFLHYHHPINQDSHNGQIEIRSEANSDWSEHLASHPNGADSPTSFMDLSDEDVPKDDISGIISPKTRKKSNNPTRSHYSPSPPSLIETSTPEERQEVERKRKRDKLAKLHRFLGSRVPVELVLGVNDERSSTPTALHIHEDRPTKLDAVSEHDEHRKAWLNRRRNSSAPVYAKPPEDIERLKENLNDEQKAIHVRRAQKMEKVRYYIIPTNHACTEMFYQVFGVPPPQTLYTRPPTSASHGFSGHAPAASHSGSSSPVGRSHNLNQSAYKAKKKHGRPGTSESAQQLLPTKGTFDFDLRSLDSLFIPDVYSHYQHSLHSLNDIIDRVGYLFLIYANDECSSSSHRMTAHLS
jgi:hypothetical protein